jgi:hypothetical protein
MSTFLYSRDLYRSLSQVWHSSPFTKGWPTVELGDFSFPSHHVFRAEIDRMQQGGTTQ